MASVEAKPHELGTLVVVVLKARNLPDKHTFTKQDPFAVIQLGSSKASTRVDKRGGQHPVWDQDLHLNVSAHATKESRTLKVSCYAKESKEDDLIGEGELDVSETLVSGEFDDWMKLEDNGAYRGEVYLEMTFFAAGPRPLARRPSKLAPGERLWRPPQTPPKSPPKSSAQALSYGSPPAHHVADLTTSPKRTHLVPPHSSRTPSPSTRSDAPLPPIPDEIPASLLPAPARVGADARLQAIPLVLRPGGPSRPTAASHQRTLSVPTPVTTLAQPAQTSNFVHAPPAYSQKIPHDNGHTTHNAYDVYSGNNNYGSAPTTAHTVPAPFAFPEPYIPAPSFTPLPSGSGDNFRGASTHAGLACADPFAATTAEREREARLAARYSSPMPLPAEPAPHVPPHAPAPAAPIEPAAARPIPAAGAGAQVPDAYLEQEREALARTRQEEADEELARRLQAEVEAEGAGSGFGSGAHATSGRSKSVSQEDADAELARRLARELNIDVLERVREKGRMPGGWS